MKDLVILCGIPGSGKTTWAHQQKRAKVISRDDIRMKLVKNDEDYFAHETEVFDEFIKRIRKAIYSKDISYDTVIADATHLNYPSRTKLLTNIFNNSNLSEKNLINYKNLPNIHFFCFYTPLETCLKRNAKRNGRARVPDDIIINMYKRFSKPPLETIIINS